MFLKTNIFKALIKKAWKGAGVTIFNTGEHWYICGYSWAALIDKSVMPNKALAALIELVGEMPAEGSGFKAGKNAPSQYEIKEVVELDLLKKVKEAEEEMDPTVVLVERDGKWCRLLQHPDTGKIKYINDVFIQIISRSEIDEEKEGEPVGPLWNPDEPYLMLWSNGLCVFGAYTLCDPEEGSEEAQITENLKPIALPGKL